MFKLRNRKSSTKIGALRIAFYVDAAPNGSHSKIRVSHRRLGLVEKAVHFVFIGLSTAPELRPQLLEHIWSQAYEQGYVPHALVGCLQDNVQGQAPLQAGQPLRAFGYSQDAVDDALRGIPGQAAPSSTGFLTTDTPTVMRRRTDRAHSSQIDAAQVSADNRETVDA